VRTIQRGDIYSEQKYWGKYRAIVVDNKDPKKLGRCVLQVPEIFGLPLVTDWAYPVSGWVSAYDGNYQDSVNVNDGRDSKRRTQNPGGDKGDFNVADIGDGVWASFEAGDACRPLWEGRWWSEPRGNAEPPKLAREIPDETQTSDPTTKVNLRFRGPGGRDDVVTREELAFPKATDSFISGKQEGVPDPVFPAAYPNPPNLGTFPTAMPVMKNYQEVVPEPPIQYDPDYPLNRVLKTKRGVVIEIDDTYDDVKDVSCVRLHIWHPSKTWTEIMPDGTTVQRVSSRRYTCIKADDDLHITGNHNICVHGNATLHVYGDQHTHVEGNRYTHIDGNDYLYVKKNIQTFTDMNDTLRAKQSGYETIDINRVEAVGVDHTEVVGLNKTENVGQNFERTAGAHIGDYAGRIDHNR
jgi:hypothetical protein